MPNPESSPTSIFDCVQERYRQLFRDIPAIYRAPGRVNLIGEHTDYNDGFVLPIAIDSYTYVAAGRRGDRVVHIVSENLHEEREFSLDGIAAEPTGDWSDYVRGVAAVLQDRGINLQGTNMVIQSEVPLGSGLSSSAALEVSCALSFLGLSTTAMSRVDIAQVCQQAEHRYAGTLCGIMDQFMACFGKSRHALLLDCRTLQSRELPLDLATRIVVCNTGVKHALAAGEYNRRRQDCEAGVRAFQQFIPGISALCDVTQEQLEEFKSKLSDTIYRRCRHVIHENLRVQTAAAALQSKDTITVGRLLGESHASLRDDYKVSCTELNVMVEIAQQIPGVLGSRMTGGGFGGCTVNLVAADAVENFRREIQSRYQSKVGICPEVYVCNAADGAEQLC